MRADPARRITRKRSPVIVCKSNTLTGIAESAEIKEIELTDSKIKVI